MLTPRHRDRVRRLVRRAMLRMMRPGTAYQNAVNVELVQSLEAISVALDQAEMRLARSNAALLAALRRQESLRALPEIVEAQGRSIDELRAALAEGRSERGMATGATPL